MAADAIDILHRCFLAFFQRSISMIAAEPITENRSGRVLDPDITRP
jgi:hypothetical protein